MKIRKKTLTKQCEKCEEFGKIEKQPICKWGNSNKTKILVPPLGNMKNCNLIYDGAAQNIERKHSGRT